MQKKNGKKNGRANGADSRAKKLYVQWLEDAYAMENSLIKALEQQVKVAKKHGEMEAALVMEADRDSR